LLAKEIDPKQTALCFGGIIGSTIVLDFLTESLNETCEHYGHV
jgi:hypothetical protein